jgi:5,6,7,8-tetrahydromethanopterin hydro-lyase
MSILDKILGVFGHDETAPVAATGGGRVIDRVLVGESLVIENRADSDNLDLQHVAHIDLIMGPRGSAAERAFTRTLTCQRKGVNGLLAVAAPNLMTKPSTVMFNKVTIYTGKQAVMMFGPAQRGVSMAVMDCVADGTIPEAEADDVFICVGVFINHFANDDQRIQDWNYRATKEVIKRAVAREPSVAEVIRTYRDPTVVHPFAAN